MHFTDFKLIDHNSIFTYYASLKLYIRTSLKLKIFVCIFSAKQKHTLGILYVH